MEWMPTKADHEILHKEQEEWVSMKYHQEAAKQTARKLVEWWEQECLNPEHGGLILGHTGRLHKHCSFCMDELKAEVK